GLEVHCGEAGSIAEQTAGQRVLPPRIDRRNRMMHGQRRELLESVVEERTTADDECFDPSLDEGCESGLDLAFGAGVKDVKLDPLCYRCRLHLRDDALGGRRIIVWVRQKSHRSGVGNHLRQQFEPFWIKLAGKNAEACDVAAGTSKTVDKATRDRIVAGNEDDGDRCGDLSC